MKDPKPLVNRVVSGGQTGVDRAALDAAIELGIEHGGWCPRGRLAEDGRIDDRYQLRETASSEYRLRTEQNVIDSDGTLILYHGSLQGGTDLTYRLAVNHDKPCFLVDLARSPNPAVTRTWLQARAIRTVNVAGPRESSAPAIHQSAREFLLAVFAE